MSKKPKDDRWWVDEDAVMPLASAMRLSGNHSRGPGPTPALLKHQQDCLRQYHYHLETPHEMKVPKNLTATEVHQQMQQYSKVWHSWQPKVSKDSMDMASIDEAYSDVFLGKLRKKNFDALAKVVQEIEQGVNALGLYAPVREQVMEIVTARIALMCATDQSKFDSFEWVNQARNKYPKEGTDVEPTRCAAKGILPDHTTENFHERGKKHHGFLDALVYGASRGLSRRHRTG